ncbi:hypothetical protein ACXU4B_06950 [Dyella soli]|uniref:Uncharacterized protein n=1 Tax=Dyella soli TaxID=522319 RepID=A0A4R0YPG4_9GAMM|nr:hypothetical protein [Dyella soli]TCI10716.1 hypothetical protein EZM97_17850 [Dyella soli]
MPHDPSIDSVLPQGDTTEITVPPVTLRHPRVHGVIDSLDVAEHDEVAHEAALRGSALRAPR